MRYGNIVIRRIEKATPYFQSVSRKGWKTWKTPMGWEGFQRLGRSTRFRKHELFIEIMGKARHSKAGSALTSQKVSAGKIGKLGKHQWAWK